MKGIDDRIVMRQIGRHVRAARKAAGISQKALAKKIWSNAVSISLLERGKVENPPMSLLREIAGALRIGSDGFARFFLFSKQEKAEWTEGKQ